MLLFTLIFSFLCQAESNFEDWKPTSPGSRYGSRNGETYVAPPWAKEVKWTRDSILFRPSAKEALAEAKGDEQWVLTYRENERALETYKTKYFTLAKAWQIKFEDWAKEQAQLQKEWMVKQTQLIRQTANPWVAKKLNGFLKKENERRTQAINAILSEVSKHYRLATLNTPNELIKMQNILEERGDVANSYYNNFNKYHTFPTTTGPVELKIKTLWTEELQKIDSFVSLSELAEIENSRYPKRITPEDCENFQFELKENGQAILLSKINKLILKINDLVSFSCQEQYAVVASKEKVILVKNSEVLQEFTATDKNVGWSKTYTSKQKQGFYIWQNRTSYFIDPKTEKLTLTETPYTFPEDKYEFFE